MCFAAVYHAKDLDSKQPIALKVVHKDNKKVSDMMHGEVEIMLKSGLHPNIVSLKDVFETDEEIILVQDEVAGGELFDWFANQDSLPTEQQASNFVRSAAAALYHLHSRKIIHNDLKPENLLLTLTYPPALKVRPPPTPSVSNRGLHVGRVQLVARTDVMLTTSV